MKNKYLLLLLCLTLAASSLFTDKAFAEINKDFEPEYNYAEIVEEAKAQAEAGDHTRLDEPVEYKMLWLAFTNVKYDGTSYTMSEEHKKHLKNVAKNFEQSVEKYTDGNIDIKIQLEYINETLKISKAEDKSYVWPDKDTAKKYIESYEVRGNYETVITFANFDAAGVAGRAYAPKTKPDFGYAFVNCELPWNIESVSKKIPLSNKDAHKIKDFTEPTDMTTLRAIHEWIHTIEWFGGVTGVDFPSADNGGNKGYEAYAADKKVEWFSFYRDILSGKAKKSDGKLTGVYPKMWRISLVEEAANEVVYTIQDEKTGKYLMMNEDKSITLSDDAENPAAKWQIVRSALNDSYQIISCRYTNLRLDVRNAWNANNTPVSGYKANPSYISAQTWDFIESENGSYTIMTRIYDAGRGDKTKRALFFDGGLKIINPQDKAVRWIIKAEGRGE